MAKLVAQLLFGFFVSLSVATAQPQGDYEVLRDQMVVAMSQLGAPLADASDVAVLSEPALDAVLPPIDGAFVPPDLAQMPPAKLQMIDLRVALVQLSIFAGTNDQLTVVRAQPADAPQVIAIQHGSITLPEIIAWIAEQPTAEKLWTDDMLRVPLVVLDGARLIVSNGAMLQLSRTDGAFLLNLGTLIVDGGGISAAGDPNPIVPDYAPFVVTAGSGIAQISHALIENLGFSKASAFTGLSVVNKGLYPPIGQSFIIDSVLRDIGQVTLLGAPGAYVEGNILTGGTHAGLALNRTSGVVVRRNLLTKTVGSAAIKVTDGATGSQVTGNFIFDNETTGVVVTRGSRDTTLQHNVLWRNAGVGISVNRADCTRIIDNLAMENRKKGIELRTGRNATIAANRVFGNHSAGLLIADQPNGNETLVTENVFAGNRVGVASASAHMLTLRQNDLRGQFPRLVEGDLSSEANRIMRDLTGDDDLRFTVGGIEAFGGSGDACDFGGES
ncbi:right-handed parallel beta-helix repeat-containing protein [Yoonia sp. 2307UL14-13]|uniref:right-handed parallel beta-helix repeat-containing protein n=1 Tax=Yoonia sp. 2307UL14-13 TaxID=3126506 RepID=UPI0030A6744A